MSYQRHVHIYTYVKLIKTNTKIITYIASADNIGLIDDVLRIAYVKPMYVYILY